MSFPFVNRPRRPVLSGFLPAGFPALLLFRNRLRLLSGAKQRIEVFGFVRPHTGIEEPCADDVFQHFFQRQTVSFIHSQKEEREHEADHQEHGGAVPDTSTGKQVGREPHRRRAGKTNKLALRQIEGQLLFFVIMTVCPHLANQFSPVLGMLLNIAALAVLILFGCHNPFMFNQSTLVLGYLLLYGYDVTGKSYQMRLVGMALGAALTCFVFYRNHKNRTYKRNLKDLIQEFDITSSRTKWQICQILCVPIVLCIAELCNMPRAMWAGIAAMSVILPSMEDMHYRVRKRIVGNIAGVICFTVLYFLLPSSIYAYIGILGGIGVGFSAQYGWQAVFNTFGALAIAAETYGLQGAVSLRVSQNVFGVVFALAFCVMFYWFMPKKKESEVTVHAE